MSLVRISLQRCGDNEDGVNCLDHAKGGEDMLDIIVKFLGAFASVITIIMFFQIIIVKPRGRASPKESKLIFRRNEKTDMDELLPKGPNRLSGKE